MRGKSSAKYWIKTADDCFSRKKRTYDFAVFLLGRNDYIYKELKIVILVKL